MIAAERGLLDSAAEGYQSRAAGADFERCLQQSEPAAREADVGAAVKLSRRQGATLFEFRAALDDYDLRGESVRAALLDVFKHMPADSTLPEMARARAALGDNCPGVDRG